MKSLVLIFLCLCCGCLAMESCTVSMRTPDRYVYIPVVLPTHSTTFNNLTSISFAVKTCNDAHIALSTKTSTSDLDDGVDMYEIVIGGWSNTQSVIRKAKQGHNLAVKKSHRPLNCHRFRRFYVRWGSGVIEVGAQTENAESPGSYIDQSPFMSYTDRYPPSAINQVFVSGWNCQGGAWRIDVPCTEKADSKSESFTIHMGTPDSYVYLPVEEPEDVRVAQITSISFAVKTCNDAHIALSTSTSTSDLDKGVDMYEIVIGGWSNTQSVIRKAKQGRNLAVKTSHQPLNCHRFRRFYVRWGSGVIEVGAQTESTESQDSYTDQPPFMSYNDSSPVIINQMFVSGWYRQEGIWMIDFPRETVPQPKPDLAGVEKPVSTPALCNADIRTPDSYIYIPVVTPANYFNNLTSISFAVKTCNDAHIALSTSTSTSDLDKGVDMYEIVIGGWSNTQSVIRKAKQGHNLAVKKSHRPVDCSRFRRFYVRWGNGGIQVGAQTENAESPGSYTDQPPFMCYKDPSPPAINQMFVSGWYGQGGSWRVDVPCEGSPKQKSESCDVTMRTPDSYKYIPVVAPPHVNITEATSISFSVKICNDAHIALSTDTSTSDLDKGVDMYEIVIGGWSNTQSVIRKAKQGHNLAVKTSHRPVDCSRFRRFYLRWENGVIEVGAQTECPENPGSYTDQPPFMSYQDPAPSVINQVFVSGWGCQGGEWKMHFPCEQKPEPAPVPEPESCVLRMRTPDTYNYIPVPAPTRLNNLLDVTSISVTTSICNNAYIALSANGTASTLDDKDVHMYEIMVGGSHGTRSSVRKAKQGGDLARGTSTFPDACGQLRRFFVRWREGLVEVGEREEDEEYPGYYMDRRPFLTYQDPSPFTVNNVFVSGCVGEKGWWEIEFPCVEELTPDVDNYPDTCTRHVSTQQQRRQQDRYVLVRPPPTTPNLLHLSSLNFSVKSCGNVSLILSHHDDHQHLRSGEELYEIIIGGLSNTISILRTTWQGEPLSMWVKHTPLRCSEFRRFYVRWGNGLVVVGAQKEDPDHRGSYVDAAPFLTHERLSYFPIAHVFTSGGSKPGTWLFEFPCRNKPEGTA